MKKKQRKSRVIDMFQKSRINKNTRLCILYARRRAVEFLGFTGTHKCDESCDHENACKGCNFYELDDSVRISEIPNLLGTPNTCYLSEWLTHNKSITSAHKHARLQGKKMKVNKSE